MINYLHDHDDARTLPWSRNQLTTKYKMAKTKRDLSCLSTVVDQTLTGKNCRLKLLTYLLTLTYLDLLTYTVTRSSWTCFESEKNLWFTPREKV